MNRFLAFCFAFTALMIGGCSSHVVMGQTYSETRSRPGFHGSLVDTGYQRRLEQCLALRRTQNTRQGYNSLADDTASCQQYANGGPPLHSVYPDDLRMGGLGGYGLGGIGYSSGGVGQIQGAYVPLNAPTMPVAPVAPVLAPTVPVAAPASVPAANAPAPNGGYVTQGQYQAEQRVILQRIESQRR